MDSNLTLVVALAGVLLVVLLAIAVVLARTLRKPEPGRALVVNSPRRSKVLFGPGLVLPVIERADEIDITSHTVVIERQGKSGLSLKENIRVDLKAVFYVRVNRTAEDVLRVAQSVGCARASEPETLASLFEAKFSEAIKTVGKRFSLDELMDDLGSFRDQIIEVIGVDLNGYILEDVAIESVDLTPLKHLDPNNILDAEGIRRLMERGKLNIAAARRALETLERSELAPRSSSERRQGGSK